LTVLVASIVGGARADSVGFGHGIAWYEYLYSQAWAILHYLQLTLWPDRLVFDYGANPIRGLRGVPGLIALSVAAVATAVAWKRATWIGFLGTWFFMLLAPSSSVVPIQTEIAAERRVYLALVPVLIILVVGIEFFRRWIAAQDATQRSRALLVFVVVVGVAYFLSSGWTATLVASSVGSGASVAILAITVRMAITAIACLIGWRLVTVQDPRPMVAALLVALTVRAGFRSRAYSDAEGLWRDAAAKVPDNPRAYDNLAAAIIQKDSSRAGDAEQAFRAAIAIDSTYVTAWTNLADVELKRGRTTEGRALLERAIAINPNFVDANERLGGVLVKLGEHQRAISYLERATSFRPTDESLGTLAIAYLALGRREEAKTALLKAVALNPRRADALGYLAAMFAEEGRPGDALGYVEAAIRAGSTTPASYALLSYTLAQLQRPDDAARAASTAATSAGNDATIFLQLSAAMTIAQRPADVERYLARAVEIEPRNPESITRLGLAKAQNGQMAEAAALFRRALSVQPGYEPAQRALARVPAALQRD
jgi:tetratricopeptide (TPR) repeat protein